MSLADLTLLRIAGDLVVRPPIAGTAYSCIAAKRKKIGVIIFRIPKAAERGDTVIALQRVVSLWEMIEIFDRGNLIASVSSLGALCKYLQMARSECAEKQSPGISITVQQLKQMLHGTTFLKEVSEQLGMVASAAAGADVLAVIKRIEPGNSNEFGLRTILLGELISSLEYQIRSFRDEMEARRLFVMNPVHVSFYAPSLPLFGSIVDTAFPTAASEIDEAGKCRATGRWTACVLHLMRALEPALLVFQNSIGVMSPKVNWQDIINQIEVKIKSNGHKHIDHQWNSEASLQFFKIKDAWRNYAVHGKERYDEERSIAIYESVRSFMQHLATRLAE